MTIYWLIIALALISDVFGSCVVFVGDGSSVSR